MMLVTHKFLCDYCDAVHSATHEYSQPRTALQLQEWLPGGWHWVDDKIACPNHVVIVKDCCNTS